MWSDKSVISLTYPGVKLLKVHKPENRKYIFLDLEIAPTAKPGKIKIDFNFINLAEKFCRKIFPNLRTENEAAR